LMGSTRLHLQSPMIWTVLHSPLRKLIFALQGNKGMNDNMLWQNPGSM
jgi:hypothetical protein